MTWAQVVVGTWVGAEAVLGLVSAARDSRVGHADVDFPRFLLGVFVASGAVGILAWALAAGGFWG